MSNGEIKIHQSILIEDFTEVYEHKADRVLLFGQVQSQVTAINTDLSTNDQSRQVTWQLPAGMQLTPGVMELADGRIGLTGHILTMGVLFTDQAPSQSLPDGSYLVVLEPDSARVQTYHNLEVAGKFLSVEPGTDRIGIWGWRGNDQTFTYGAIDPVKGFVTSGSVSGVDPARDMTLIFSNRLLTAAADQVALYDLGSGAPLLVAAVSETAPELKAIDMVLRLTKDGTKSRSVSLGLLHRCGHNSSSSQGTRGRSRGCQHYWTAQNHVRALRGS